MAWIDHPVKEGIAHLEKLVCLMNRYFASVKKGKVKASPEIVKLWGTNNGREMLRKKLYQNNMDMGEVNLALTRESIQESEESVKGAWKTEAALAQMEGWDEQMAKNAVRWATSKNLSRVNEIHGKTEYRVPLNFEFKHRDLERATTTASSETVLEDGLGILTGPDAAMSCEATIQRGGNVTNRGLALANANTPVATPKGGNGKLVFPVLQCGADPFSTLHIFVEIAGKKIDKAEDAKEKLDVIKSQRSTAANQELDKDLGAFRACYEKIVNIQTNAMQMETVPDSSSKGELRVALVELTKCDCKLSQTLHRCRAVKDPNAKAKSSAKKSKAPASGATSSTAKPKRSAAKSSVKKRKVVVKPESDEEEEEEQEGEEEASVAPTPRVSRRKAKTKARK